MAAISILRPAPSRWPTDHDVVAGLHRRGLRRPVPPGPLPGAARRRALPDRATRVRRRRLALLVAVVVLAVAVGLAVQALRGLTDLGPTGPRRVDTGPAPVAGEEYVVQPGDTLWSIAEQIAPGSDPRPVVDALREANGGPTLEVGTRLRLDV